MAQYPPPGTAPQGAPAPGQRPGPLTTVAVLLFIGGGLAILGGVVLLGLQGIPSIFKILGVVNLVLGAAAIYAGVQVLNLKEIGRKVGITVAVISVISNVLAIGQSPVTAIIGIAIYGFIIYTLIQNAQHFRP